MDRRWCIPRSGTATVGFANDTDGALPSSAAGVIPIEESRMVRFITSITRVSAEQAPAGETDLAEWDRVIDINLNGVLYGMRYQIPAMLKVVCLRRGLRLVPNPGAWQCPG